MLIVLLEQDHVGSGIVRLHHVDRKAVIFAGIAQAVSQVGFGLSVTLDVVDVQVQDLVVIRT